MRCDEAKDLLYSEPGVLRRALLRLHLLRCPACRAEAECVKMLGNALTALPRFTPPAGLLEKLMSRLLEFQSSVIARKENRKMRRIMYASVALLIIAVGIGLLIPARLSKPNAKSILLAVAHAMENADSVYVVYESGPLVAGKPRQELQRPRDRHELWLSDRAVYQGYVASDGTALRVSAVNADTLEWRVYQGDISHESDRTPDGHIVEHWRLINPTLYVADLTPIAAQASRFVSKEAHAFFSGEWSRVLGSEHIMEPKQSVAIETRQGRKVAIVTVTGGHRVVLTKPGREDKQAIGTARNVFEVDLETNHLLSMRTYLQAEGFPERLTGATHKIEYDAPVPTYLAEMPDSAKRVKATATIETSERIQTLIMQADGKGVDQMSSARE